MDVSVQCLTQKVGAGREAGGIRLQLEPLRNPFLRSKSPEFCFWLAWSTVLNPKRTVLILISF